MKKIEEVSMVHDPKSYGGFKMISRDIYIYIYIFIELFIYF